MVCARLHIICGNCGCNDMFQWDHRPREMCGGEIMTDGDVYILCRNCSTLHGLSDNAENKDTLELELLEARAAIICSGQKCGYCLNRDEDQYCNLCDGENNFNPISAYRKAIKEVMSNEQ